MLLLLLLLLLLLMLLLLLLLLLLMLLLLLLLLLLQVFTGVDQSGERIGRFAVSISVHCRRLVSGVTDRRPSINAVADSGPLRFFYIESQTVPQFQISKQIVVSAE